MLTSHSHNLWRSFLYCIRLCSVVVPLAIALAGTVSYGKTAREALDDASELNLVETPLSNAALYLADVHGVAVEIADDVNANQPVTFKGKGKLGVLLEEMVKELQLELEVGARAIVFKHLPGEPNRRRRTTPLLTPAQESALHIVRQYRGWAVYLGATKTWSVSISTDKLANNDLDILKDLPPGTELLLAHRDATIESRLDDRVLNYLAPSSALIGIQLMDIPITDIGVRTLAGIESLRDVGISGGRISGAGAAAISSLPKLETLSLYNVPISEESGCRISEIRSLRRLSLSGDTLSAAVVGGISRHKTLQRLSLNGSGIANDEAIERLRLAESRIEELYFGRSRVTNRGLANLSQLKSLRHISIHGPGVTDDGVMHLAALPSLEFITLYETGITDAILPKLGEFRRLQMFHTDARLSSDAVFAARIAFPNVSISLEVRPRGTSN